MDIMLHDGKWYRNLELLADDEVDKYIRAVRMTAPEKLLKFLKSV